MNRAAQQRRQQAQPKRAQPAPRARPAPPPRDARDIKCTNCGLPGHTAAACKKPKTPIEERRCHTCGKQGHISSKCPDRLANVAEASHESAARPQHGRILAVEDESGVVPAQRRGIRPRPLTLADLPMPVIVSQAARRRRAPTGNRFQAIAEEEEPCPLPEPRHSVKSRLRADAGARTFRGLSLTTCGCGGKTGGCRRVDDPAESQGMRAGRLGCSTRGPERQAPQIGPRMRRWLARIP